MDIWQYEYEFFDSRITENISHCLTLKFSIKDIERLWSTWEENLNKKQRRFCYIIRNETIYFQEYTCF